MKSLNFLKNRAIGLLVLFPLASLAEPRQPVRALYMPLADHYAGILAEAWYGDSMEKADYQLIKMPNWYMLEAALREGQADMAFIICPEALHLFHQGLPIRWIGLLHRDGNSMIVNNELALEMNLAEAIQDRKPDAQLANAVRSAHANDSLEFSCGIPHKRATHSVIAYKYFSDHGLEFRVSHDMIEADIFAQEVPPASTPAFIRAANNRSLMACTQQSLPWGSIVENQGQGRIAWFSRDILKWPGGHVECIIVATESSLKEKRAAIEEVVDSIIRAGERIETMRKTGEIESVVPLIQSAIPEHSRQGILDALSLETGGIRFNDLALSKNAIESLRQIMDIALKAKILSEPVDLDQFIDKKFLDQGFRKDE